MKETVKRDKRNIGKVVRYINPKSRYYGRLAIITGFRGDWAPGIPNVTLSDGNSIPGNQIVIIK